HELLPGFVAMILGGLALASISRQASNRHAVLLYTFVLASALILSLGPLPTAWGHRLGIPGPYAFLLRVTPGLDGLRAPARLAVVVQVGLAVLAAVGGAWLLDRIPGRGRVLALGVIACAVAAEGWSAPARVVRFDPRGSPSDRDAYDYLR